VGGVLVGVAVGWATSDGRVGVGVTGAASEPRPGGRVGVFVGAIWAAAMPADPRLSGSAVESHVGSTSEARSRAAMETVGRRSSRLGQDMALS
jgi:hypothetical protein